MPRSTDAEAIRRGCSSAARHLGLDWIRGLGAVAVVLLHAGIPYLTTPMSGLAWPVRHPAPDPAINALFWGIEACVMPLFLMLSGYVTWRSLSHRGTREFLLQRVERIGYPLLAAACVLLPLELYLWMLGWVGDGLLSWKDFREVRLGPLRQDVWGLSHLWYLQYVLFYSVLLALGTGLADRWRLRSGADSTIRLQPTAGLRRLAVPGIVVAIAAVLWWEPAVVLGFQHSFLPVPAKFAYCGLFFAWGVLEASRPAGQPRAVLRHPALWLGAAALLFPAYLALVASGVRSQSSPVAAGLLTATCVSLTFGWWSACERLQASPPAWGRYLAGASFWIYLVHHPLVPLCQISFRGTGWTAQGQFAMTVGVTLYLALASYEVAVRRTAIGRFLNGRSDSAVAPPSQDFPLPARQAA